MTLQNRKVIRCFEIELLGFKAAILISNSVTVIKGHLSLFSNLN